MSTEYNPIRGRFNAWFLRKFEDLFHKYYGTLKKRLFASLPEKVVELGPGTGANFRYYHPGTIVTAIEPNLMMHGKLRENAKRYGIKLDIHTLQGEHLDLANESADAVVGTLVLCTVGNPQGVLREVYRVLRPGGKFLFIEHVGAPRGTLLRRIQELISRPWKWFFEGCHPDRDTALTLRAAGFSKIELEDFTILELSFNPITHHIAGIAIK